MTDKSKKQLTEDELKKAAGGTLPAAEPGKVGDKGPRDARRDTAADTGDTDRKRDAGGGISPAEGSSGIV